MLLLPLMLLVLPGVARAEGNSRRIGFSNLVVRIDTET